MYLSRPLTQTHKLRRWLQCVLVAVAGVAGLSAHAQGVPVFGYNLHQTYPHDPAAFTQGLFFNDGFLFESTGMVGKSTIRKVDPETGRVIRVEDFPSGVFGEGIVSWQNRLLGLSWRKRTGYVWALESFALQETFSYGGEGWGLTHDGTSLIMSDGTSELRFLDPETFEEQRRITVKLGKKTLPYLNELEWVNDEILANVWQTNYIARIDPASGQVRGLINLTGLLKPEHIAGRRVDVLNGIALAEDGRLWVTGKYWPLMFVITPGQEPIGYVNQ